MTLNVTIDDATLVRLVNQRIGELFGDDARYRQTALRDAVRQHIDEAVTAAVRDMDLHAIIDNHIGRGVSEALHEAAHRAVKTRTARIVKLGIDPERLTDEERAWLEEQVRQQCVRKAARAKEEAS